MNNWKEKLCVYDPRNPSYDALSECFDKEDIPAPAEEGCACDNCFYGRHELADALLARSRWTPIEEADWDGEMNVEVIEWTEDVGEIPWATKMNLSDMRDASRRYIESKFYVYPSVPSFNPEDCEVKP